MNLQFNSDATNSIFYREGSRKFLTFKKNEINFAYLFNCPSWGISKKPQRLEEVRHIWHGSDEFTSEWWSRSWVGRDQKHFGGFQKIVHFFTYYILPVKFSFTEKVKGEVLLIPCRFVYIFFNWWIFAQDHLPNVGLSSRSFRAFIVNLTWPPLKHISPYLTLWGMFHPHKAYRML